MWSRIHDISTSQFLEEFDRETPLAEIVGLMPLSRSTDIWTQSWVFISVKKHDLTKLARWLYTHKQRELMAGDEVSGNNVVEGEANNRSDVYTSCTNNNVSETHMDIYIDVCWILLHAAVSQITDGSMA